jgi:hypothetical protein
MKRIIKKVGVLFFFAPLVAQASSLSRTYSKLYNPLPTNQLYCPTAVCDLVQLFLLITADMLRLIPVFSVIFIIVGGFQMILSGGNEEKLIQAKETITWAILGFVISALSFSIVAIVKNLLHSRV